MEKLQVKIKFLDKSSDVGGQIYFTFITELNFIGRENPKVVKALEDFKILSKIVKG